MKIVITGGAGFIGRRLATVLRDAGHDVAVLDCLTPQIHGHLPNIQPLPGVQYVREDVRRLANQAEVFEGMDVVFHLAAETGTAQSMYKVCDYVDVNELGTAAVLEALAKCRRRPARLILASSRAVYGEGAYETPDGDVVQPAPRLKADLMAGRWEPVGPHGETLRPIATSEDMPFVPGSVYAATKASQELLVRAVCPNLNMTSVILRFQNVYGEGQSLQNPYTGIISIFYNRMRQGMPINIFEDGEESRDFVHVDDVVEAMRRCVDARVESGRVINIGSGNRTTVRILAESLARAAHISPIITVNGQFRVGDVRHNFADTRRMREELGFVPTTTLDAGLLRFCLWAGTQPEFRDRSEDATRELQCRGLTNA